MKRQISSYKGKKLCLWQKLLLSAVLGLPSVAAKVITDTLLFFASFQIQRRWVFAVKPRKQEETVHV